MIETSLGAPMIAVETRNGKRVIGTARVQLSRHREAQNSGGHGSATTPIAASHNPGMA
jgi:hypothetical protein